MKFEIIERADEWIVQRDGVEVVRFTDRSEALSFVTEALRGLDNGPASLGMRFERRTA